MRLGRIDKETTANIGIIKGGIATNIIPERVELKGEARSHRTSKLRRQISHMERELSKACRHFKARLKLKVTPSYNSFDIGKKEKVLEIAVAQAKRLGMKPSVKETGGGSDANIFNEYGIPTIILGVGAEAVHTKQERIDLDDMVRASELLLEIIKEACLEKL